MSSRNTRAAIMGIGRSALSVLPSMLKGASVAGVVVVVLVVGLAIVTGIASDFVGAMRAEVQAWRIRAEAEIVEAEAQKLTADAQIIEAEARNVRADAELSQSEVLAARARVGDELAQGRERAVFAPVDFSDAPRPSKAKSEPGLRLSDILLDEANLGAFQPYVNNETRDDFIARFNAIITASAGEDDILARSEIEKLIFDPGTEQSPLIRKLFDDYAIFNPGTMGRFGVLDDALGLGALGITVTQAEN